MSEDRRLKIARLSQIVPSVSRETTERLLAFEAMVVKWQAKINLVANATLPKLWTRHILDSAQIYPLKSNAKTWCDIGSGGGFPSIVTAIFLKQSGGSHIDLVESNGKKVAFLRTVIAELDLPATVHQCRIEDSYSEFGEPEVITARALASLDQLLSLSAPWLMHGSTALFQKGRDYASEVAEANANWTFNLIKHDSKIDEQSVILEITDLRSLKGEVK
ncbi:16S rRNA (guanine(527)-N(7))-methyltransferase RsmG [Bartonella sp. LJL80]